MRSGTPSGSCCNTMPDRLAIHGGKPVRSTLLPYGRQSVDDRDIAAVVRTLRSDWLTTGPTVVDFEQAFAETVGARHAVAVSSGTAALHAAMFAVGVGPDDEVVVPAMTFAASASCVLYQGGTPVFADVDPATLLIDPGSAEALIGERTRAIVAVDYAGQPCEYETLRSIAKRHDLHLIADACHALGGTDGDRPVGSLADLSVFSFHPVKAITAGEGGVVVTDDPDAARRMRVFRNHGITADHRERSAAGSWAYEIHELGFNYRLTDLQCALAMSQLDRLGEWVERRRAIAARYERAFGQLPAVTPLTRRPEASHAYHLYVVRLDPSKLTVGRREVFEALRAEGIGVNVHYIPVHLHPLYRRRLGTGPGLCPVAERAYDEILSLPLYPAMADADVGDVIEAVTKVCQAFAT